MKIQKQWSSSSLFLSVFKVLPKMTQGGHKEEHKGKLRKMANIRYKLQEILLELKKLGLDYGMCAS